MTFKPVNSMTLKKAGFWVLSIPLICQVIFSVVLYFNITTAQKTVQTEIAAKGYNVTIQKLITAMLERLLTVRLERQSSASNLVAEAASTKDSFRTIVNQLFTYEALSQQAKDRLSTVMNQLKKAEVQVSKISFNNSETAENASLEAAITSVFSQITLVGTEVAEKDRIASEQNMQTLALVKQYLSAALLLSSIGGIFLAWLVGQLAYKPISHILTNAKAIANDERLVPLRHGPPELIGIDSALIEIARTLSDANARQHNLYKLSPAMLLELSDKGQIIKGNETLMHWLHIEETQFRSCNFFNFFKGAQRLRLESQFELTRESGLRRVFQLSSEKLFSLPNHTQWTVTWNDESRSYFCVAHDITDSTNIERLRDQISSYLTIELGAPLKTIASLIGQSKQITISEGSNPWAMKQLEVISNNVERLTNLLNQLDQSTDPENLEKAVSEGVSSNKAVISHAIEAVRSLAQVKKVQLIAKVEWAMVRGTESELERVLINLISNAIKFTPDGSRIEISSQPDKQSKDGEMIRFTVLDQGKGIPEQARSEIFAPFKQLANARESNVPSTGLGLSVCKTIVERCGGKIWVENGSTGGAAFNFVLPPGTSGAQKLL